jgi:hypothetical protein
MSDLWIYAVFAALAAFVLLVHPTRAANAGESQSMQAATIPTGAHES